MVLPCSITHTFVSCIVLCKLVRWNNTFSEMCGACLLDAAVACKRRKNLREFALTCLWVPLTITASKVSRFNPISTKKITWLERVSKTENRSCLISLVSVTQDTVLAFTEHRYTFTNPQPWTRWTKHCSYINRFYRRDTTVTVAQQQEHKTSNNNNNINKTRRTTQEQETRQDKKKSKINT